MRRQNRTALAVAALVGFAVGGLVWPRRGRIKDPLPVPVVTDSSFASQAGQDRYVWDTYFKARPLVGEGFFVEFGARDGLQDSNSFFFEKALGWKGILVEPLPSEHGALAANRPRSAAVHGGVCEKDGRVTLMKHEFVGYGGLSDTYDARRASEAKNMTPVDVECFRLSTLIDFFGIRHVNFMSVDVEGAELQALRSFPWGRVSCDVVSVEVLMGDAHREQKEAAIVHFMKNIGYGVAKHHPIAGDTKDIFFVPVNIGFEWRRNDYSSFDAARDACVSMRRCLSSE